MNIIYYGTDGRRAKAVAAASREDKRPANVRHAEMFDGAEPATMITILACVSDFDAARIDAAYPADVDRNWIERTPPHEGKEVEVPAGKPAKAKAVEVKQSAPDAPPPGPIDPVEAARRDVIDIPDGWEKKPYMWLKSRAIEITGNKTLTQMALIKAAIADEVARRAAK